MRNQDLIKEAREKLSLTQQEVAEKVAGKCGFCTVRSYYSWERGKHAPRPRQLRALAEALGLQLEVVRDHFSGSADSNPDSNPFDVDREEVA